jgi:hypothetical protein
MFPGDERPRWLKAAGLTYVVLSLGLTVNLVLGEWGAPNLESLLVREGALPGAPGLALLGWLGLVLLVLALWRGGLSGRQWAVAAAVGTWLGATALSMTLHGQLQDNRFWSIATIATATAAGGALAGPVLMRCALLVMGWFYGWGSVLAGIGDALFGWPSVLVDSDPRYGRWLSMVGPDLGVVPSLNGVTPGRVYVGLTCAILLVFAVRTLRPIPRRWWHRVMPAGLVLAILWSFSRTGIVASVLGLLAALVPYERFRRRAATAWTFAAVMVIILLPMSFSALLQRTPITDGTTTWRFDLWQDYLRTPGVWTPFGIGPKPASPQWADHAHHHFLEALATGGWLGLAGSVALVWLAVAVGVGATRWDNRATIGVVFVMAAIFQVDVVTFSANYAAMNNALILLVAIVAANAAWPARQPGPGHAPLERASTA